VYARPKMLACLFARRWSFGDFDGPTGGLGSLKPF